MEIVEAGHIYKLAVVDGPGFCILTFVNREGTNNHAGTQTQEVLRVLIDRTKHCDNCLRWDGNDKIIYHLRMALALHESRAIERKAEKGLIEVENISVNRTDGHYDLTEFVGTDEHVLWMSNAKKRQEKKDD